MLRGELQRYNLHTAANKATENPFSDVQDEYVSTAYYMGIVKGKSSNTFDPDGEITRQEAALMLVRAFESCRYERDIKERFQPYSELSLKRKFADFDNISSWAREGVFQAEHMDFMNGVGNKMFDPLGKYTVEQSLTTIIRLYIQI